MRQLVGGASVPDRDSAEILAALNSVADDYNVDPAAIAGMIHTESVWDTRCVTGSYIGLTQVGPELPKLLKITKDQFLALSAADQIQAYGKWLGYYRYLDQIKKYGMHVGDQPLARQAAVLQAMQFAPNGAKWKTEFANGNYLVPSTSSKQAHFLGDTSIHDMEAYYGGFFKQHPPSYAEAGETEPAAAAPWHDDCGNRPSCRPTTLLRSFAWTLKAHHRQRTGSTLRPFSRLRLTPISSWPLSTSPLSGC
jgi:hypothetical protein